MTKKELSERVAYKLGLDRSDAKEVVDAVFEIISTTLIAGEDVALANFARFKIVDKPAKNYRNTVTGEMMRTEEGKRVKVKMSETVMKEIDPAFRPSKAPASRTAGAIVAASAQTLAVQGEDETDEWDDED